MIAGNISPDSPALQEWAAGYRKQVTAFLAAICFVVLLATEHSWARISAVDLIVEFSGFVLIGIGTMGRIWSAFYISGYKNGRVVAEGPYALVRNPLYVFSFAGVLGVGLASENILVMAILICAFMFYYPLVVRAEERHLTHKFGDAYTAYAAKTPRFFPDRLKIVESDVYAAKPRQFRRTMLDAMWFFWFFMILQIIERMHHAGWLPVLFQIP
jgi:protein-S-isoprenylcysteine O-methyltransferase Ste14